MINRVQKYINGHKLFTKDNNLLLAISGGADSVCLFFILKQLGYKFELAHCNFNLRGKESQEDESFVKELANKYAIKYHIKSFETQKYANKQKISIQMAARNLRYEWFQELLLVNHFHVVVLAHNQDDNIETFFINLIRGSGINGLCGIKAKNNNIVRPLLDVRREDIEKYLYENNIAFCNDRSNLDLKYKRNKIRHQLIPLLKEMNPNIQKTIAEEISILDGTKKIFHQRIDLIRTSLLKYKGGIYKLNISDLMRLEHLDIFLFEILKKFGFFEIEQIIRGMKSQSGKQFFSATHQLIIDRREILISLHPKDAQGVDIFKIESEIQTPLNIKFIVSDDLSINKDHNIAKLDLAKLSFPLRLRKWKFGDKFKPLGMSNFKKLSDFFIDNKFSRLQKQNQWLLCSKDSIVWVVGHRIDDRYKVALDTKKVYIAELLK